MQTRSNDKQKMKIIVRYLKEHYYTKHHLSKNKFQLLIATILSQRTRDENTERAASRLFSAAKTPEEILKLPTKKLQTLIKPSGPYRQKAKHIQQVCKILIEKYNGGIPHSRDELLALPGVGFKTSAIVLMYGFNIPIIAVDVHVAICSQRLGLTKHKDAEKIRKDLEKLIPKKDWHVINLGFVEFGKEICRTRNPKCLICNLNNICPYGKFVLKH